MQIGADKDKETFCDLKEKFPKKEDYLQFVSKNSNLGPPSDWRYTISSFVYEMKPGDIIFLYNWKKNAIEHIGIVGKYYYNKHIDHLRNVHWHDFKDEISIIEPEMIEKFRYFQAKALHKIEDDSGHILKLLEKKGIKFELPEKFDSDEYQDSPNLKYYNFDYEDIEALADKFNFSIYDDEYLKSESIRKNIINNYPPESWLSMDLEDFALGIDKDETFSKTIEFRSTELGGIKGGAASKHKIFKQKKSGEWYYNNQKYGSLEEAWNELRKSFKKIIDLADEEKFTDIDHLEHVTSNLIRLKTLYIYHPDKFIPIYSPTVLRRLADSIFTLEVRKKIPWGVTTLNHEILKQLRTIEKLSKLPSYYLMKFIWEEFIDERNLQENLDTIQQNYTSPSQVVEITEIDEFITDSFPLFLQLSNALTRKGQVILYGPPGTGKTYNATLFALYWILYSQGKFNDLKHLLVDFENRADLENESKMSGQLNFLTFHPSYSYEDFIEGFRPVQNENKVVLSLEKGIFQNICTLARNNPQLHYLILIDEINRAHLSKVLGELITLLEKDKREMFVQLPYSKEMFSIPKNVFIIGTMNTVDFSLRSLDFAIRRRFGFVEVLPEPAILDTILGDDFHLGDFLRKLNQKVVEKFGREKQIGHAYFMLNGLPITEVDDFQTIFYQDILSLLVEYASNNFVELVDILGSSIIDSEFQRINYEILENGDALISELKKIYS